MRFLALLAMVIATTPPAALTVAQQPSPEIEVLAAQVGQLEKMSEQLSRIESVTIEVHKLATDNNRILAQELIDRLKTIERNTAPQELIERLKRIEVNTQSRGIAVSEPPPIIERVIENPAPIIERVIENPAPVVRRYVEQSAPGVRSVLRQRQTFTGSGIVLNPGERLLSVDGIAIDPTVTPVVDPFQIPLANPQTVNYTQTSNGLLRNVTRTVSATAPAYSSCTVDSDGRTTCAPIYSPPNVTTPPNDTGRPNLGGGIGRFIIRRILNR